PINGNVHDNYILSLLNEMGNNPFQITVKSIYIGGGTPSLLKVQQIATIITHVNKLFKFISPEITIEVNPDDINEIWIKKLKDLGINRISIGIQSFFDEELKYLGRRHNAKKAIDACKIISTYFDNWSLDLIFGIPFQTMDKWKESLKIAVDLNPKHISTYNLTFEEGTSLYKKEIKNKPDDDFCLDLYKYAEMYLKSNGYEHYEISNFAKKDYQCIHNLIYWHNEYYLGVGTGAFSFIDNLRCSNSPSIEEYIKYPGKKEEMEYLTDKEIKLETLIQYFRLSEGIHEKTYFNRFSTYIDKDFGIALNNLIENGFLEYNHGRYKPTPRGFYLNNEIGRRLLDCMSR
ncbi:MAG: radical SAM family heme chaperone HemW, partial [Candidatus Hydrogenedens sp.]